MKVITKQIEIAKTVVNDEIENQLSKYGEVLRWAIVDVADDYFLVEAAFII